MNPHQNLSTFQQKNLNKRKKREGKKWLVAKKRNDHCIKYIIF